MEYLKTAEISCGSLPRAAPVELLVNCAMASLSGAKNVTFVAAPKAEALPMTAVLLSNAASEERLGAPARTSVRD